LPHYREFPAALLGETRGGLDEAPHLAVGIGEIVPGETVAGGVVLVLPRALIDAAGILARDQDVELPAGIAARQEGLHLIGGLQRADLEEQIELPSEVVDETAAGGAVQNGAAARENGLAKFDDLVGQRAADALLGALADLDIGAGFDRHRILV